MLVRGFHLSHHPFRTKMIVSLRRAGTLAVRQHLPAAGREGGRAAAATSDLITRCGSPFGDSVSQLPTGSARAFASSSISNAQNGAGGGAQRKQKHPTKRAKHLLDELEREQVSLIESSPLRKKWPDFKPGDAIEVQYKTAMSKTRYQKMRGIVLGRKNRGIGSSFVLHNIVAGEAFEIRFPLYSPLIEKITMVKPAFIHKGKKRVRRAKLNYLRNEIASKITVKDTH